MSFNVDLGVNYSAVAASQTSTPLGALGGKIGDFISHITVVPTSTSPGAVTIADGAGAAITVFAGGAASLLSLVPFPIPIGAQSLAGGWKATTGTGLSIVVFGRLT